MLEKQVFLGGCNMTRKFARKWKAKAKQSLYRPGQALSAPRISRDAAHKGGRVVSHVHWLPLAPWTFPWNSFLLEAESKVC